MRLGPGSGSWPPHQRSGLKLTRAAWQDMDLGKSFCWFAGDRLVQGTQLSQAGFVFTRPSAAALAEAAG